VNGWRTNTGFLAEEVRRLDLVEWWNTAFTGSERERLEQIYAPIAKRANDPIFVPYQSAQQLLEGLAWTIGLPEDLQLAQKVLERVAKLTDSAEPGLYHGRYFTTYVNEVKAMIRDGREEEAERVLLGLVKATEQEGEAKGWGVASWYYERLAIIYRRRRDYGSEIAILERYSEHQKHFIPEDIQKRLERARGLLARASDPPATKRKTI
jgi:hypothetical protein